MSIITHLTIYESICSLFYSLGGFSRLERRVPLVEQEFLTFPQHQNSPQVFSDEVRVVWSLVFCVMFSRSCLSLCSFSFSHLSFLLRFTDDSDYHFGIFKLFLAKCHNWVQNCNVTVYVHFVQTESQIVYSKKKPSTKSFCILCFRTVGAFETS